MKTAPVSESILDRITVGRLLTGTAVSVSGMWLAGEVAKALAQAHQGRTAEMSELMRFWLFGMFSDDKLTNLTGATSTGWQMAGLLPIILSVGTLAYALWILFKQPKGKKG